MARHDRVEKEIDTGERSNMGGGGAGRVKAVTSGGAANATVHAGGEAAKRAREKEGGGRPLLLRYRVEVGGGGGGQVGGTEGASGLDQLHQFGVADEKPLKTVGARQGRAKGKGRAGRVKVKDRGADGSDGGKVCSGGRKPSGVRGNWRGERRANVREGGTR